MEIRPRPAAQNPGRMLGSGMNPEDWIELTKRTECNCECVGQSFVMTPEDQREDFVKVGVEIGDRRYAEAEGSLPLVIARPHATSSVVRVPATVSLTTASVASPRRSSRSMPRFPSPSSAGTPCATT